MKLRIIIMEVLSKIVQFVRFKFYKIQGYSNIEKGVILESGLNLDKVNPSGIIIKKNTLVASRVTILTHEHVKRNKHNRKLPWITNTEIGENCFIGINAMILPGVKIGNNVIIGASSVVTKDIPDGCIAVGNPAKVIKKNIEMDDKAILVENFN